MDTRVIYSDNGTLIDFSTELENYYSGSKSFDLVAAEDYIYIGSDFPFNHKYLKMDGVNVNSDVAVISDISYWTNNREWVSAVEVIDETKLDGKTFGQSGYITWVTDKEDSWYREDTSGTKTNQEVQGLTDIIIYDKYWIRITFSADLTAGTAVSWLGNKFSDDYDLGSEFPELNTTAALSAFKSGKTDWEEQHVRAAQIIINDLKKKNRIDHGNQILERNDLTLMAVSKLAELIYVAYGDDYADNRTAAKNEYIERLNSTFPVIDKNLNARKDRKELSVTFGEILR